MRSGSCAIMSRYARTPLSGQRQGAGYQTRIKAVLRDYVERHGKSHG